MSIKKAFSRVFIFFVMTIGLSSCFDKVFCENIQKQLDEATKKTGTDKSKINELEKQVDELERDKNKLQARMGVLERDGEEKGRQAAISNSQLKTVSTCMEGMIAGGNYLSQNNPQSAYLEFSAVARECKESQKIIQQQTNN